MKIMLGSRARLGFLIFYSSLVLKEYHYIAMHATSGEKTTTIKFWTTKFYIMLVEFN